MLNPFKQRLFLWAKLPGAAFMGCRITIFSSQQAEVTMPYGWRSQNPFKSIYFAAQCSAAELSTGILALAAIADAGVPVSMLVFEMRAEFVKKAVSRTRFTCTEGAAFAEAIQKAIATGEGQTLEVQSVGVQENGEVVSRFWFTWTFKAKKR